MPRRLAAIVLGLLALSGVSLAEEPTERVTVSYIRDVPEIEAGRAVLEEAYRRIGVSVTFLPLDAAEALEASRSGEADAELNRVDGADRRFPELVPIPIPVNWLEGAAFSRQYRFPIRGWSSLKPYKIGVVRGIVFSEEGTAGMDVRAARDYEELVRWIAEGEVEVGVMLRTTGREAVRASGRDDVVELEGLLETLLMYHYVNVARVDLGERLEPVLKEMLLDGTTRRLLDASLREILESEP